jgi:hypothetical protein
MGGADTGGTAEAIGGTGAVGGWTLRAQVPDGIFTLGVEAGDEEAAASRAAFADRCAPLLCRAAGDPAAAARLRADLVRQLAALRAEVARSGIGYLGAVAGERGDGRVALILLAVAATPMRFPPAVDPASLLTTVLARQYPGAAIEEFDTESGVAAGIQRVGLRPGDSGTGNPRTAAEDPAGLDPGALLGASLLRDALLRDALLADLDGAPAADAAGAAVTGARAATGAGDAARAGVTGVGEAGAAGGVSQALVPFPEAGLLGAVTGFCFNAADVAVATVFTAAIAFALRAVPVEPVGLSVSKPAAGLDCPASPAVPATPPGRCPSVPESPVTNRPLRQLRRRALLPVHLRRVDRRRQPHRPAGPAVTQPDPVAVSGDAGRA